MFGGNIGPTRESRVRFDDSELGHFHAQHSNAELLRISMGGRLNFARSLSKLKLLHSHELIRLEFFYRASSFTTTTATEGNIERPNSIDNLTKAAC